MHDGEIVGSNPRSLENVETCYFFYPNSSFLEIDLQGWLYIQLPLQILSRPLQSPICSNDAEGAAAKTAPTNAYKPPLKRLAVVVLRVQMNGSRRQSSILQVNDQCIGELHRNRFNFTRITQERENSVFQTGHVNSLIISIKYRP